MKPTRKLSESIRFKGGRSLIVRKLKEIEEYDVAEAYGIKCKGVTIRWISEKRLGGPEYKHNFALRYFVFQPGGYLPLHKHPWEQEIVVVKGTLETTSGGRTVKNEPGDIVYIPADEEHGFRNIGDGTCEFYCIIGCVGEGENCIGLGEPHKGENDNSR